VAHRQLEDVACSTTDALQFLVHLVASRRPNLVESVQGLPAQLDQAVQEHYGFLDTTLGRAPFVAGIHWRSHRIEWACRLGLARWLATEIEHGRAFFSPPPRSEWARPSTSRES
jgi:hypothetical protein